MRDIRFRAWHIKEKQWHYFDLIMLIAGYATKDALEYENWCRFAGLMDKSGVDIYEGDKVDMLENYDEEGAYAEWGIIVWNTERCCFLWDYQNKHNEFWTLDEACPFEVISNIHEEKL